MKRLVYWSLLVAASCVLMTGSASRPAVALETNPILLADCLFPASDCCNPACKGLISGCCVNNSCGLPVAPVVYSKFGGLSLSCSAVLQPLPQASTPKPPAPPPPAARPKG